MAFGEALGMGMGLPPAPSRPRKKTSVDKEGAKGAAAIKVGAVPKEGKSFEGLGPSEKLVMAAKPDNTNQQAKLGVYPSNQMQPTKIRTQVVPIPIPIDPAMMGGDPSMGMGGGGMMPPAPPMGGPPMGPPPMGPSMGAPPPPPGIGPSAGMMPPPMGTGGPPPPMGPPPMGGPPGMMPPRRRPGMM